MHKIIRIFRILFENLFINYKKYDKDFSLVTNDTIISFNIRADHPRDNKTNWVHRRDAIIEMIKDKKPSIICMQEVQSHMFKWLYKKLYNQYECIECVGNKNHTSLLKNLDWFKNGLVIWYDKTKISLESSKCVHEEHVDPEKFLIFCNFIKDDYSFTIINTHYSLNTQMRNFHTSLLNKEVSKIHNDVYVCGDFNDSIRSEAVKNIKLPYHIPFDDETQRTFNHFDDTWAIIDFIFSNKEINTYEIITKDYGVEYISDHYPIETPLK